MSLNTSIKFLLVLSVFLFSLPAQAQTMFVKGRHLYSAAGEKVVLRGINEMFIWSRDKTGETILPEIAKTGANACRLVWTSKGAPEDLDQLISNTLKNKMIPMVELHDATGDWSKLQICLDYWKREDVKAVINKHKKWVLLNIANEVGRVTPADTFSAKYIDAVTQLRASGYEVPLIIDAANWGQDETNITATWRAIQEADPKKQVLFSVHTYWQQQAQERLDKLVQQIVHDEIPFIFGEAPQPKIGQDCSIDFPYLSLMKQCQEHEIGWLVWSWGAANNGDCGSPNSPFDITKDGTYGNWEHSWNKDVVVGDENSIQKTSVRPVSMLTKAPVKKIKHKK